MPLLDLFAPREARARRLSAQALLASTTRISRAPGFFGADRVADTLEGRTEMVMLHAALALRRLRTEGSTDPLAQAFTDVFFRHLDAGLREAGVGDLTVPKRMKKLAQSFYGRLNAYAAALDSADQPALAAALRRNILRQDQAGYAARLAAYAHAQADALNAAALADVISGAAWQAPPPA